MTKLIIILIFPFIANFATTECKSVKEGTFKLKSEDGSLHTIVRNKNKQTENVGKTGLVSEFDIKWISDCTYLLYNRKVLKGVDNMPAGLKIDTLYNEIIEVDGDKHKIVSSMKGYDIKIESILLKISE